MRTIGVRLRLQWALHGFPFPTQRCCFRLPRLISLLKTCLLSAAPSKHRAREARERGQ
ncbi:unnamed protein product, partial [Musa textilis]